MILLKINNLTKIYLGEKQEVHALQDVSFDVYDNEFLVIMGASGSGKSTLLNLIGGIDNRAQGSIEYEGKNILKSKKSQLTIYRQRIVGTIFQNFNLVEKASIRYNLKLPRLLTNNIPLQKDAEDHLLSDIDLKENTDRLTVDELSIGGQQRVAVARAMVNNPKIILADEPTGNLDQESGVKIVELLKKLHDEEKKTIILVTHNPDFKKYADRILYLADGKIENIEIINDKRESTDVSSVSEIPRKRGSWARAAYIASHNILRERWRYLFVSLATGLGIASTVVILSFGLVAVNNVLTAVFPSQYNSIILARQKPVVSKIPTKPLDTAALQSIKQFGSFGEIYPVSSISGKISYGLDSISLYATTASPVSNFHTYNEGLTTGHFFHDDSQNGIILTSSMLTQLGLTNTSTISSNSVELLITQINGENLPIAKTVTMPVLGVLDSSIRYQNALVAYNYDNLSSGSYGYDSIFMYLNDQTQIDTVASKIVALGYRAQKIGEQIYGVNLVGDYAEIIIGVIFLLGLIATIASVFSLMGIIFYQRIKEIALLKVFGPARGRIMQIYIVEGLLFGIGMGIITVIIAFLETLLINSILSNGFIQSVSVHSSTLLTFDITETSLLFIATCIIALALVLFPAVKAARVNILEGLDRV